MITVKFGIGNEMGLPAANIEDIDSVLNNPQAQALLGFSPDAVTAHVNGQPAAGDDRVPDGSTVVLSPKAHGKGTRG